MLPTSAGTGTGAAGPGGALADHPLGGAALDQSAGGAAQNAPSSLLKRPRSIETTPKRTSVGLVPADRSRLLLVPCSSAAHGLGRPPASGRQSGLHLAERHQVAATDNQVEFTRGTTPVARQHAIATTAFGHPFAPEPDGALCPGTWNRGPLPAPHGGNARSRVRQRTLQRTRSQRDQKSRFSLTLARFPIRSRR